MDETPAFSDVQIYVFSPDRSAEKDTPRIFKAFTEWMGMPSGAKIGRTCSFDVVEISRTLHFEALS